MSVVTIALARKPITANRYEQLSGIRSTNNPKILWDKKYGRGDYVYGKTPAKFLVENYHYIKPGGTVLDMGMGEGRNAVFLSQKGYKVTGVDISSVAVKKARKLAKEQGTNINGVVASLTEYKIPAETFDAILAFYYVDRDLNARISKWLRPGGILVYEAYTEKQKEKEKKGSSDFQYYLKEQELLSMFPSFKVLKYEEPTNEGNYRASIVLQKPKKN